MNNTIEIHEVCDVFDGPHATPKKTATGPIYLGIDAITADCRLNPLEYNYLSEEDYKIWTKRVTPVENDIVFSYEATLGRYAMIPADFYGCLGRRLALIRVKDNRINPTWLYYYFMSPEWKVFIANHTVKGSTVDRISVEAFPSYKIPLIERQKQDDVVKILKSIDDKIENNNTICSELESMAKTLYDYWFVQFDFPDENGKPYRTSGGEMVWNEQLKREIPKGWEVKKISDICEIISGYPFQSSIYSKTGKYRLITIKNVQDSGIDLNVDNYIKDLPENLPDYCILSLGDILMSLTGNVGRVGLMYTDDCILNQRVALIKPKYGYLNIFLYFLFKSDRLKILMENISTGTSQKNLSPVDTGNLKIAFDDKIVKIFCCNLESIITKIAITEKENSELTKLRDWLLPMLMNGQARVE